MSRMSLLVPRAPVRGQVSPGEPLSSSGSTMGRPHLPECLAPHLHLSPRGTVETEEKGEISNRLWLEVGGLHGKEVPGGAIW